MMDTIKKLFTLALLTMVSMGAWAKIEVEIANNGKFDGGTITEVKQSESGGKVTVTIGVMPDKDKGYTIKKDDIHVYATYPLTGSRTETRTPNIAGTLTLYYNGDKDKDTKDLSSYREYTFIVESGLNAWVKEATFTPDGRKGGDDGYSGTYFISMPATNGHFDDTSKNFYLVPTEGWCYFVAPNSVQADDNGQPFLTTFKCGLVEKAKWTIIKQGDYYYIKHVSDGKFLTYNGQLSGAGLNRARVHLESSKTGDNNLFSITNDDAGHFFISPKAETGTVQYLNVTDGNKPSYTGSTGKTDGPTGYKDVGGIIGRWNEANNTSQFCFDPTTSIAPPTITNNFDGTFTIEAATGATIYYTTDGTAPTTSTPTSGVTSVSVNQDSEIQTIKAIAKSADDNIPTTVTVYDLPVCSKPMIKIDGSNITITAETGTSIYYTTDDTEATPSKTQYNGPFSIGSITVVRAIATKPGYYRSSEAKYYPATPVSSSNEITDMTRDYILSPGFQSVASIGTTDNPFTGKLDGNMVTLSGLDHPLVAYANGATIKNVILDNVNISSGTNVGAICGEATGDTRIYNCGVLATNSTAKTDDDGYTYLTDCSSTISGSGYVGGIVGLLDGSSRVINCFSYANISGGTHVGGIVGYNKVATTATNLKTMVMNCMFYGEVSGWSIAPIYNGEIITNEGDNTGVSNFNYFRLESSYIENTEITKVYNCALGAETRFLQRFEFFRHLLNSNRELAAWWATGYADNKEEMMKWVMEPSQIGTSTPYPILKTPGKYASVVNYTPNETAYNADHRNEGGKLTTEGDGGVLHVTIQSGSGGATGASLTTTSLDLTITDKDFEHFNFNYGKVQLPYYNDVGTKNYTDGKVVTGWKIVSITGGTDGSYSTGSDVTYENGVLIKTPYNFADRKCTNKDLYDTGNAGSDKVFNQGAYWDVPEGVSAITIEPYWGKAVYLADSYLDVVYSTDMKTAYNVTTVGSGSREENGRSTFNNQVVCTSMSSAVSALSPSGTVYDNAVVLVGNYHLYCDGSKVKIESGNKPYTVTSVDLDGDNEPDYSFMLRFDGRTQFHPVRYDFLNLIGLGMAQKSTHGSGSYNFGIMQPINWFEVTNTALFRVTQLEYERSNRAAMPLILQGGVIEQWVSYQSGGTSNLTTYIHVGGNVWFKEFHMGVHQDKKDVATMHPPVSVTGGDFNKFYLTGLYQSQAANYDDNAECYINGGRFGEMAGAGMEGIGTSDGKGNVTWVIDNADIKEFYGGGINFAKPVRGNIHTIISNSHVDQFCGGPKFGDMEDGRTVITTATNCNFDTYFGAGYGGNSYNRYAPTNQSDVTNINWNIWVNSQFKQDVNYEGVSTQIAYQFIPMSGNVTNVARLFVDYVGFSLATCRNVTSSLNGCKITGNFYGGGSLGKVDGSVTSTLTNCTVNGNVFGAGYSASLPTVEVMKLGGFETEPYYYEDLGTYRTGVFPETETYKWLHGNAISIDKTNHILYTTADLTALGKVTGIATLNIENGTTVIGNVYGGGESSDVVGDASDDFPGNVVVNINGGTINGNVHGGGYGKTTEVGGDVLVNIGSRTGTEGNYTYAPCTAEILGDVYGGSAFGSVNTSTSNTTTVNLFGGTIHGDAYGGGLGQIGRAAQAAVGTEGEEGYVPAVTEIEDVKAQVKGEVNVTLDGTKFEVRTSADDQGNQIPVSGRIFGCNNLNGSPEGDVKVTIERTVGYNIQKTDKRDLNNDEAEHRYELAAVYGGGNLAAYLPNGDPNYKKTTSMAHITINGCEKVSIQQVYGGGNAASTPAAQIDVNGTYEIEELFGGGNGMDRIQKNGKWYANPGANMGFLEYADNAENAQTPEDRASNYGYGSGETNVNIYGGRIHRVFGGANTKGNVWKIALTILKDENQCTFMVDEAYGGGKSASMDGAAELKMACIPGLKAAYGGAQEADINNDVTLNITNGTFDRVFGGNNKSGHITGTITVNIEETGCKPVIIGQVYGGGNLAPYTAPTKENGPTVNLKSFTSIGEVYGGGFGATAVVTGDTHVNINEVILSNTDTGQETDYSKTNFTVTDAISKVVTSAPLYNRPADTTNGSIGVIGNIYGGGNEAKVVGDTYVKIGNLAEVEINTLDKVNDSYQKKEVKGADIRGNVYGGGNQAEVTGNTNVVIGQDGSTLVPEPSPAPARETTGPEDTN